MSRELIEQVEELLVARDEAAEHEPWFRSEERAEVTRPLRGGQTVAAAVRMFDLPDRVALRDQPPVLEQLDQHDAGEESTDVRPYRHAAGDLRPHGVELRQP